MSTNSATFVPICPYFFTLHSHLISYIILGWTFTLEAFLENMRWKVVMALAQLLSCREIRPTPWSRCWQGTQRKTMTYLSLQINATSSGRHHQLDAPAGLCLLSWWRARVQAICRGRICFHRIECKKGWVVRSHKYVFASGSWAGGTSSGNL